MYTANTAEKRLTAYRIDVLTLERLKSKAKIDGVSVNTLVETTLSELVKDIKSDKEIEEEKKRTKSFLDTCWGSWSGDESSNEIKESIKSARTTNREVSL